MDEEGRRVILIIMIVKVILTIRIHENCHDFGDHDQQNCHKFILCIVTQCIDIDIISNQICSDSFSNQMCYDMFST